MCGICGYIVSKNQANQAKTNLPGLLVSTSRRGGDATGISYIEGKRAVVGKEATDASEFIKSLAYKSTLAKVAPDILIGHCRAQTKGDKSDNNNNHPIVTKSGLSLVHNGVIRNDEDIFTGMKLTRSGLVDSEVIVRLIDHYKISKKHSTTKAIQEMSKQVTGSMGCALIDAKDPDTIYLWTNMATSSPVTLALHQSTGSLYFASTPEILKDALLEVTTVMGVFTQTNESDWLFYELPDCTGVKIKAGKVSTFTVSYAYTGYSLPVKEDKTPPGEVGRVPQYQLTGFGRALHHAEAEADDPGIPREPYCPEYSLTGAVSLNSFVRAIEKPSKHHSDCLNSRLGYILILPTSLVDTKLITEARRIVNTLTARRYRNTSDFLLGHDLDQAEKLTLYNDANAEVLEDIYYQTLTNHELMDKSRLQLTAHQQIVLDKIDHNIDQITNRPPQPTETGIKEENVSSYQNW